MSTLPSAVYHLMLNPSWLERPAQAQRVIEGLAEWEMDANETHDGVCLLRGLLRHARTTENSEPLLIQVVQALLERGAKADAVFEQDTMIRWACLPGVKQALTRHMYPSERVERDDPRGLGVISALRGNGGVEEVVSKAESVLGPAGMSERIDGLLAGAWVALHARPAGDALPGWCVPLQAYGGGLGRMARIARRVVTQSGWANDGTAQERLIAGLGLAAAVIDFSGNNDDRAAQQAALNTARKLVQGLDASSLLLGLGRSDLSRDQKSRLGAALLSGGPALFGDKAWDMVRTGWGLLDDKRMDRGTASAKLVSALGPPIAWLDDLPRSAINQEILLDFLAGSLDRFSPETPQTAQARINYIEALGRWRAGHDLPGLDIGFFRNLAARNGKTLNDGIAQALEAIVLQANTSAARTIKPRASRL